MKRIGIIGGGASGIICAIAIKHQDSDANVVILEKESRIGKKILMTGNGKCNLSNLDLSLDCYNTDVIYDSLLKFDSQKCIEFFERIGLMVRIDNSGRIYPYSERANNVLDILLYELKRLNVEIVCDFNVIEIKRTDEFLVYSDRYDFRNFDYLVLATGGLAHINYDYQGYEIAERLGHQITPLRPGLVGVKVKENTTPLAGLRMKANVYVGEKLSYGEVQFKKDGLSGIAIMDMSRYFMPDIKIRLDLMPDKSHDEILSFLENKNLEMALMGIFPKMIAKDLLKQSENNIYSLVNIIKNYEFTVLDTYGFTNAQITIGGVNHKEVSPFNFSSLIVDKLYIVGEILDIDGKCGGYNLHFAWTSGFLAGVDIGLKGREEQ
ncbi:MAG TPA: aminoacetone oxidase family FAD-binding enzyme [Acholeplasmataceae bacterium]|jgi:predicted Rossmann fold flavoprotein|nr:aminoacetone oxidase family FAD-binding enzyme [Acholeplasmataceae bacterium]